MGIFLAVGVLAATFGARAFPVQVTARPEVGLTKEKLAAIASVAEEAIRTGKCPGAVVVIGHEGRVIYRKAFGHRALVPEELPMTVDTIFDVASLTKVVATTTAIMQLVEQGKIVLSAPVTDYWPEFKPSACGSS
jgi:CubicO group peptidase (beta-lactamase class C family)